MCGHPFPVLPVLYDITYIHHYNVCVGGGLRQHRCGSGLRRVFERVAVRDPRGAPHPLPVPHKADRRPLLLQTTQERDLKTDYTV